MLEAYTKKLDHERTQGRQELEAVKTSMKQAEESANDMGQSLELMMARLNVETPESRKNSDN